MCRVSADLERSIHTTFISPAKLGFSSGNPTIYSRRCGQLRGSRLLLFSEDRLRSNSVEVWADLLPVRIGFSSF